MLGPAMCALAACAPPSVRPTPAPDYFDHVIVAIDSLDRGIALLKELTGIAPVVGGIHPGRGTQNALLSLGAGAYLELLAPNPSDRMGPSAVASYAKYRALTPVGWAARTTNADSLRTALLARGERAGEVRPGARALPDGRTLRWRTLAPWPGGRENLLPFFIEWAAAGPHPSADAPAGCTLESMQFIAVAPDSVRGHLANAGIHVSVTRGTSDRLQIALRCGARIVSLPTPP